MPEENKSTWANLATMTCPQLAHIMLCGYTVVAHYKVHAPIFLEEENIRPCA